jgi:lipopolysaccharide heptosyltransferase II
MPAAISPPTRKYRYVRLRWRILFGLIDAVGWLMVHASRIARLSRRPATFPEPRTILLVQLDHLGDAILSTGMLRALVVRYPDASIEVLTSPRNQELFEACPGVRTVHVARENRFSRRRGFRWIGALLWWSWKLRRRRFDLAIDARGEFPHALLLWLMGAKRRVGWTSGGGDFLLTDAASYVANRHESESRQALLNLLDIQPPEGQSAWPPTFDPGRAARDWIEHEWPAAADPRPLIVIHVGAGTQAKRWPAEHFRELIGRLAVEHDVRIALVGTGDDWIVARQIIGSRAWPNVWNLTGLFNVARLGALLERAAVMIGADSGPVHLAAAVGTPVVVLFSGTNDLALWKPRGPRVTVLRHEVPCAPCYRIECPLAVHACMTGLSPARVAAATRSLLPPRSLLAPRCIELSQARMVA